MPLGVVLCDSAAQRHCSAECQVPRAQSLCQNITPVHGFFHQRGGCSDKRCLSDELKSVLVTSLISCYFIISSQISNKQCAGWPKFVNLLE